MNSVNKLKAKLQQKAKPARPDMTVPKLKAMPRKEPKPFTDIVKPKKPAGPDLRGPLDPKEKKRRIHEWVGQFKDRRLA